MARSDHPGRDPESRYVPLFLLMFVGSGCAALIYEVVWFQLLRQVIGASAISLGILLSSYMGGLFLGSLAFPRYISMRHHPLKVYALLEIGIGACGVLMLVVLPLVRLIYIGVVGYGLPGIMLRALVCVLLLLPPTILMGATLPAISRYMEATRIGICRIGALYTANIAGAVAGCLLAGFYLLRVHDMVVATLVAAAINAAIAVLSFAIVKKGAAFRPPADTVLAPAAGNVAVAAANPWVYVVIGVSGFTALGAQVVWTRLISLLFGGTVYTFSIILAVFLIGLAIGSAGGSFLARQVRRPGTALAWAQLLLVLAIPVAAFMIAREIPFWYLNPDFQDDIWLRYGHDLLRAGVAMSMATVLWGASFPLALAAAGRPEDDPGSLVGRVYAANTAGAILGSAAFAMYMIPAFGTHQSQQRLTLLSGLAALSMFLADRFGSDAAGAPAPAGSAGLLQRAGGPAGAARLAAGSLAVVWLTVTMVGVVTPVPDGLVAYGRFIEDWDEVLAYHYVGEGMNASVAVSDWPEDNVRSFHVGGKVVASTRRVDMRLQRMLGHLPALFRAGPRSVLVVGFGAGVTAGSFTVHDSVERIVVCEIEPLVADAAAAWLGPENFHVRDDPRTEMIFDDARHFIATTDEKFDVITSDPIHPWVSGSAALYSAEYYELVKQRLNPGGVVAQWLPLYETSEEAVKSSLATFMQAFPDGTVWNSDVFGEGYDVVMIGSVDPLRIDLGAIDAQLASNPALRRSLADVDFSSGLEILSSYVGQAADLQPYLADAQLNRDRSLRLQYLAGLALDENDSVEIFQAMAQYRRYPEDLFVVPPSMQGRLREAFSYGSFR